MNYVLAVLVGLAWGVAAALLNAQIMKQSLKKDSTQALIGSNLLRSLVDLAALAVVFLLRNVLPFPFSVTLIATAVGLSVTTIVISYRLAGTK